LNLLNSLWRARRRCSKKWFDWDNFWNHFFLLFRESSYNYNYCWLFHYHSIPPTTYRNVGKRPIFYVVSQSHIFIGLPWHRPLDRVHILGKASYLNVPPKKCKKIIVAKRQTK
jgi:hypothetical protein